MTNFYLRKTKSSIDLKPFDKKQLICLSILDDLWYITQKGLKLSENLEREAGNS